MRILYVAMKYDYGKPEQGFSFEHCNFFSALRGMGHELLYFDFRTHHDRLGKAAMNRRLLEVARSEKPDLLFAVLFAEELDRAAIRSISDSGQTVTLNWFCDDHWRFDNYSRLWAPSFNWVVTTAASAVPKYDALGYRHVIKSQWACNPVLYKKLDLPVKYDVTFVGLPHGNRREIIEAVRQAGIEVKVWGNGWNTGRLTQQEMIETFNQSRINLNLSNASVTGGTRFGRLANLPVVGRMVKALFGNPNGGNRDAAKPIEQIKGRNFEVPGCGGFLLSGYAQELEKYYRFGEEIGCFADTPELIDKICYYLQHEQERQTIAAAGYRRTMQEHTYPHRFEAIFRAMGLPAATSPAAIAGTVAPGPVHEV